MNMAEMSELIDICLNLCAEYNIPVQQYVAMNNYSSNTYSDIYAIFSPNDVKSADPVTYDSNGNIIPLSERFDTEHDDIRYSNRNNQHTKINPHMTDTERANILKNKKISAPEYVGQADKMIAENAAALASNNKKLVKSAIKKVAEQFSMFENGVEKYHIDDIKVDVVFSSSSLIESSHKAVTNGKQLAKLLPILKQSVEGSIGVNKYKGQNGAGIKAREELIKAGYDGVNNSDEEYIAFYPEQIKCADLITYDDNGRVIPISKRFNNKNDDIRYSGRGKGYIEQSMSVNAYEAYNSGEMPISKWTKKEMLDILDDGNGTGVETLTLQELKDNFLKRTSWHHTGAFYNATDFYAIDEDAVNALSKEYVDSIIAGRKRSVGKTDEQRIAEAKNRKALVKARDINSKLEVIFKSNITKLKTKNGLLLRWVSGVLDVDALYNNAMIALTNDAKHRVEQWRKLPKDHWRQTSVNLFDSNKEAFIYGELGIDNGNGNNGDIQTIKSQLLKQNDDIRYSNRNKGQNFSNRSLLANALDTAAQTDVEKEKLSQYKQKIDVLNSEEAKLTEIRAKIKELSFAKGKRDVKAIKELQDSATKTANRINTYDRQLLNIEASKPLKDVLAREKTLAYKKAEQQGKEALTNLRERSATKLLTFNDGTVSVQGTLGEQWGTELYDYLKKYIDDLNGGIKTENAGLADMLAGKMKVGATALSASVVAQQGTSVFRIMSEVPAKYFLGIPIPKSQKARKAIYNEMRENANIAIIKEMGGFDTHSSRGEVSNLTAREYNGLKEKAKGFFTDKDYRGSVFYWAAMRADENTWIKAWEAIKRETADTTDLEVGSKEFLKKCGERFNDVMSTTQVYDSSVSKSGFMRSSNGITKMATNFMAEPTVTINGYLRALVKAKRSGNKALAAKIMGRTVAAYLTSQVAAAAMRTVFTAMRDDSTIV